ncbi:MAG: tetratricopeptide repeat protein [Taibaiella sp.]|nr:tetratricopeptide repeat protein [Taibaiella sp.]
MSTIKKNTEVSEVEEIRKKTSRSIVQNQKLITGIIIAVVVLIGGYFGYQAFIQKPNEEKASNAMFTAEQYFGMDSFSLALNGDGQKDGFANVISKYGSTKAGNLARYYAAACYLHLGQPQEAVKHLEKFNAKGTDFEALSAGLLAAAYDESGNKEKALDQYTKAVKFKNAMTAPFYLRCASIIAYDLGKTQDAVTFEQQIKKEYPNSPQSRDTDKYLALYGHISFD